MAWASLHEFYVITAKLGPPEIGRVTADPIHYTGKVGVPSEKFLDT